MTTGEHDNVRVGGEHDNVRVGIVLEVDDSPLTLYIWAHLVAATMVEDLQENGVVASVVRVDIDDLSQ